MEARVLELKQPVLRREERGYIVLSPPSDVPVRRRILYINSYGGRDILSKIDEGVIPAHHMWGCFELVRAGYEVMIAEPLTDFYWRRKPMPHDLKYLSVVRKWLGADGIVYCGHNVLYWIPALRWINALKCRVVSLLFGREPLNWASAHDGIIALNPAAADHAAKLNPSANVAHLSWGVSVNEFPQLPYDPQWLLSCGVTQRDHIALSHAAREYGGPIRVLLPNNNSSISWSSNVRVEVRAQEDRLLHHDSLVRDYYGGCVASLIILKEDRAEVTGCGFTNLLEAFAMARPVIVTRTGAAASEIDVEAAGCGIHVPANDPRALAEAMRKLAEDPSAAEELGRNGRRLIESRYNIERFARDLHAFFETL